MKYYLETTEKVLIQMNSSKNGLKDKEAKRRLEFQGKNKLEDTKKECLFKKIINSILDPMIIMLLITAVISAVISAARGEKFTDVFIILFVVVINTIMSLLQESKAEKAIDSLKEMTALKSKVIRDGKQVEVNSEDLVLGDIIVLEAGDLVPADARVIESHSMKVDEASLTGESVPVEKLMNILNLKSRKDIPLADRQNMVYSGSTVTFGRGMAVVVATGMNTEIGKIAKSLQDVEKKVTPLQRKMGELSKTLTKVVLGICLVVFVINIARNIPVDTNVLITTAMTAIALAVAAIPEGLPAVVTIILSIGVTQMSRRKALIRKLNAVETLGCTQVICSDKTGTLTKNKMTVEKEYSDDNELLAKAFALCSDSKMGVEDTHAVGEPTENGLVEYAHKLGLSKDVLDVKYPRIGEVPFDSNRKMMTVIVNEDGRIIQYTKGACEILLNKCTKIYKNGRIKKLTEKDKEEILRTNEEYASNALRVLSAGFRELDKIPNKVNESIEQDLVFIGLVGMMDPVRDEVKLAIEKCKRASIRPIMITGDQITTAIAIGKKLKIIKSDDEAILGQDLEEMSDEDLIEAVKKYSVYARVQPEHKTRIVKALKSLGHITAMTGDGVNDAPSIKASDVGIGMGITGTNVTKNVSDVVLADDNFATIVNAVEEGRRIYDNVKKVLQFQLATNMAEVLTIFASSILGITVLSPVHLLWVNMITDSAPGLSLGMEKAEGDIMRRKPRKADESIFAGGVRKAMFFQGSIMAIIVLTSFFVGQLIDTGHIGIFENSIGVTMAFVTMNFVEMFHAVSMRSQKQLLCKLKSRNWYLITSVIGTAIITFAVLYIPAFVTLFGFTTITITELVIAIALAALIIPIIEVSKVIKNKIKKK